MTKIKSVAGYNLLYVMATLAEFQDELKTRFEPLICEVGPVEAAMYLTKYLAENPKPDLIISLGSAGAQKLEQAEVYQVSSVAYRDMDASAFGFKKGETPFSGLPVVVEFDHAIPDVRSAALSTGANVVSGDAYDTVEADMVDMETWAIKRVCQVYDIPLIGLRGISDGAEPVAEYEDWTRYLEVIDQQLALAVDKLEKALEEGTLKL